jgi:hypothetical protein
MAVSILFVVLSDDLQQAGLLSKTTEGPTADRVFLVPGEFFMISSGQGGTARALDACAASRIKSDGGRSSAKFS